MIKNCSDRNYAGECPMSEFRKCKDVPDCPNQKIGVEDEKKNFGKIYFGQYKGTSWDRLPEKYLEFLMSKECKTNTRNKLKAREILNQRKVEGVL